MEIGKLMRKLLVALLVLFCLTANGGNHPYPAFFSYIQAVSHNQVYCKADFTPEGRALIKHYFGYAISICGDEWDKLTVDSKMRSAYQYYVKRANEGDGQAAYIVAFALMKDIGVDNQDASGTNIIGWFKKSFDSGYPPGMAAYAGVYKEGTKYYMMHLKEVNEKRFQLALKAAEKNAPGAYGYLIMVYDYRKNYNQVRFLLERAKKANYFNNPELVNLEANARISGKGFLKNPVLGLELLKKVLTYKNALMETIQVTLAQVGDCYYTGLGTKKDLKQAFYYYRQSALLNYGYSQNKLGDMYYSGLGVKQDKVKANYWYCKAYNNNYMPTRKCNKNMNRKSALKGKI